MSLDHGFLGGPDRATRRRSLVLLGLLLASAALLLSACGKSEAQKAREAEQAAKDAAYREKYAKAKALFEERCKTAGVVVKRVVKDVEGIELTKIRQPIPFGGREYFDPMFPGAAMADEAQGDAYIASFLYSELRNPNTPEARGVIQPPHAEPGLNQSAPRRGYRYVDVADSASGHRWRYHVVPKLTDAEFRERGGWAKDLERTSTSATRPRFALDFEDIVDPDDRAYWVAGTRIKVIDQQTGEVIAQLTRFVWDPSFGVSSTGRLPWQHAGSRLDQKCPYFPGTMGYATRFFSDTVLQPKQPGRAGE